MGYSINTEAYHYIEWYQWNHKTGTRGAFKSAELYDRANDPHEKENLAQAEVQSETKARLSKQLAAGWKAALPPAQ